MAGPAADVEWCLSEARYGRVEGSPYNCPTLIESCSDSFDDGFASECKQIEADSAERYTSAACDDRVRLHRRRLTPCQMLCRVLYLLAS